MTINLIGRRCTSVKRFQHRFAGQDPSEPAPIEFTWDDGTTTTLDANADWTLDLSTRPWDDPLKNVTGFQRVELADEVGLWEPAPPWDALSRVVGQSVSAAEVELDDVGELTGIRFVFEDVVVRGRVVEGDLTVELIEP